jgi:aminotransferase
MAEPSKPKVQESVIRKMTRLAAQYNAVNLSQGFPNEPPPRKVRLALALSVLSGNVVDSKDEEGLGRAEMTEEQLTQSLLRLLNEPDASSYKTETDVLNQYSPPMGRPDARLAVSQYYERLYDYSVSPDDITLTVGATEACATAFRTVGKPGDKIVIFEPFHELYPSQCGIFYLDPVFVTLKPCYEEGTWNYDEDELNDAVVGAKALVLNTPHNPTGKVFHPDDLKKIIDLCIENKVYIITDEIYEHSELFPGMLSNSFLMPKTDFLYWFRY